MDYSTGSGYFVTALVIINAIFFSSYRHLKSFRESAYMIPINMFLFYSTLFFVGGLTHAIEMKFGVGGTAPLFWRYSTWLIAAFLNSLVWLIASFIKFRNE